jgi:AraC family transcriptional regulator
VPENHLNPGEFYSTVTRHSRDEFFLLSELRLPQPCDMPAHSHELAYITLLLEGSYGEQSREAEFVLSPFTAVFNPSGIHHKSLISRNSTRTFTIELTSSSLRECAEFKLPGKPVTDYGRNLFLLQAIKLYVEFTRIQPDMTVAESLLWEMIGNLSGKKKLVEPSQLWFKRLKEQIHEGFRQPLRLKDLAREAGVHPVHVAKTFRSHYNATAGEYLQWLRVQSACNDLGNPDKPLADVALENGFADQSHLTRLFKRIIGVTPGAFRQMARKRT